MSRDLKRLLSPRSIAVVGGGAWCLSVIEQAQKMGFSGEIFPVHPTKTEIAGLSAFPSVNDTPSVPDATFIGINRDATIDVVTKLHKLTAGGAVCFASGFAEAQAEDESSAEMQTHLLQAAGEMPILGPNCYGFVNALDGALLWPDQHGCKRVDSGVAILTQSSNIAINLSMQKRGLPIAYLVTCGNMAQTSQAEIAMALLEDPRVTAIGLHIEGFADLRQWEDLARIAKEKSIPLVALKVGKSVQAQAATVSHTASLAGGDAGAQAFLERLRIARVADLSQLMDVLKIFHVAGPLKSIQIASISCSGGEASLAADASIGRNLEFPPLNEKQKSELRDALGPKVALANPLDYHTYIWRDTEAMTKAWSAMVDPDIALTMTIVDYPREDICDATDWDCATQAAIESAKNTGGTFAVVASLPELMPENISYQLIENGVIPMHGLTDAMAAIEAAVETPWSRPEPLCLGNAPRATKLVDEPNAKSLLSECGVQVPASLVLSDRSDVGTEFNLTFPVVAKTVGLAHKSEHGGVELNIRNMHQLKTACSKLPDGPVLIEEMVQGGIAEILVGVTRDPAHGFVLTLAAGGTLTEIMNDSESLLVPSSKKMVKQALSKLKLYPVFTGFRGQPSVSMDRMLDAIVAVQTFVIANKNHLTEIEINPLICTSNSAVAGDALIKMTQDEK